MAARARKTTATKTASVASDLTFPNFITELMLLCQKYDTTVAAATEAVAAEAEDDADTAEAEAKPAPKKRAPAKKAAPKKAEAPAEDEDDADADDDADDAEDDGLDKLSVAVLRKRVLKLGTFEDDDVKTADKDTLIAALREETGDGDDDADSEGSEDDDDAETAVEDRKAELEELTIAKLRGIARDDLEAEASNSRVCRRTKLSNGSSTRSRRTKTTTPRQTTESMTTRTTTKTPTTTKRN